MKFTKFILASLALAVGCSATTASDAPQENSLEASGESERELEKRSNYKRLNLKITNLTYRQTFSPMFYMVHKCNVKLYELGSPANHGIETLAEDGSSVNLLKMYNPETRDDICSAGVTSGPLGGGNSTTFRVRRTGRCPCVSIATMAIVTNDCFVAVNGEKLFPRDDNFYPGLDSGTEDNTELCTDIPGCGEPGTNANPEGGEGFVHVHRGIEGKADLGGLDQWLNPMMRVQVW